MQRCDLIIGEGATELALARRLLNHCHVECAGARYIDKGGSHRFWADANRYAAAANQGITVLGLADLENASCAGGLFAQHLPNGRPRNFKLRVAVRMAESWLLADADGIARWLKISRRLLPDKPDEDPQAKRTLVGLARRSPVRSVRDDMVPAEGTSGVVGQGYLPALKGFIAKDWAPDRAAKSSPSLAKALRALMEP